MEYQIMQCVRCGTPTSINELISGLCHLCIKFIIRIEKNNKERIIQ